MIRLLSGLVASSLVALCFTTTAALAQSNNGGTNNSNASGTNNSNQQGYGSSGGSQGGTAGFNASVINQAQALQQRLAAARAAVSQSQEGDGVRRFVRNPNFSRNQSAEQAELERVKAEIAAFLESLKNPNANLLDKAITSGNFSNITW